MSEAAELPEREVLAALIELYRGLARQGPGDPALAGEILAGLPPLPPAPRIADLGCGTGTAALMLAERFGAPVVAVDRSREFLAELAARARARGLESLVRGVEADFGALDWPEGSLDLLWSEGAAYHLTFAGALERWRPLLARGGVAVISEAGWFTERRSAVAREFWARAYPTMGTEAENVARGQAAGFAVLAVHRVAAQAWWDHYYGPLLARVEELRPRASAPMQVVLGEVAAEVALFRACSAEYGYSFYVLQAS